MASEKSRLLENATMNQIDRNQITLIDNSEDITDAADITGELGKWQITIFISVLLIQFVSTGMFALSIYLFPLEVDFRCREDERNFTATEQCWTCANGTHQKCRTWEFDKSVYKWTLLEKWSLVCDKEWILSFSLSSMLFGKLLGSLIAGVLGDKFGRRKAMLISLLPAIVSNTACFLSEDIVSFLVFQCISAGAGYILSISSYVLLMEVIDAKNRVWLGTLVSMGQTMAAIYLAVVAFTLGDWRYTQLAVTLPVCLLSLLIGILPESPRWLIANNRLSEAKRTLENALRVNKNSSDRLEGKIARLCERVTLGSQKSKTYTPLDLFRVSKLRTKTILFLIICGSFGALSASLLVNVAVFGVNLAGMVFLSLAEIPGTVLAGLVAPRIGVRYSALLGMASLAVTTFACSFTENSSLWLQVSLVCVLKLESTFVANILSLLSTQLFPTVVRAIGIGMGFTAAKTASLGTPYVKDLKIKLGYAAPFWLFTALASVALLTTCFLHIPNATFLPETLEDLDTDRSTNGRKVQPS